MKSTSYLIIICVVLIIFYAQTNSLGLPPNFRNLKRPIEESESMSRFREEMRQREEKLLEKKKIERERQEETRRIIGNFLMNGGNGHFFKDFFSGRY